MDSKPQRKESTKGYRSIIIWPQVNPGDPENKSTQDHETEDEAKYACFISEHLGVGSNGKIFPISTRVELITSPSTHP